MLSVMMTTALAICALLTGVLLADLEPLTVIFIEMGMPYLTQHQYTMPVFFVLVLWVIKRLYNIWQYTDEDTPLKLAILALVMSIVGLLIFFRILTLGTLILVAAAYWSHGIVKSYYPRSSW